MKPRGNAMADDRQYMNPYHVMELKVDLYTATERQLGQQAAAIFAGTYIQGITGVIPGRLFNPYPWSWEWN